MKDLICYFLNFLILINKILQSHKKKNILYNYNEDKKKQEVTNTTTKLKTPIFPKNTH